MVVVLANAWATSGKARWNALASILVVVTLFQLTRMSGPVLACLRPLSLPAGCLALLTLFIISRYRYKSIGRIYNVIVISLLVLYIANARQ